MAVEVKKLDRETTQGLIRRFSKAVQQSGILLRAREIRFKKREKSETVMKKAALRRETLKQEYEKLKKLGQLKNLKK